MSVFQSIWFDFLVIPVLSVWSGLYAAAEIAIISVRKSRLQELVDQDNKKAKLVQDLLKNHDDFFAIVQIGMTVLPSLASALSGIIAVTHLKPLLEMLNIGLLHPYAETIAIIIVVIIISYLTLIIGELVPKSLGLRYSEGIALAFANFILLQLKVLHPIIKFLSASTNIFIKPLGKNQNSSNGKGS